MCSVCGCGQNDLGHHAHEHKHHDHQHKHHDHQHKHHGHQYGADSAGLSVAGFSQEHLIEIEQDILSKNDSYAEENRRWLADHRQLALNLVSSPGAGKTTLLVETLNTLSRARSLGVIEGDQATTNDADRIRETGVPAIQINTGRGCHLDAHMVGHAFSDLSLQDGGVVFIENVGNLVCPAAFDLGEAFKVVILSVTEGDDKPLKYPDMFAAADVMILSKIDLLPHVDFDADKAVERALRINPDLQVIRISARDGTGIQVWCDWIENQVKQTHDHRAVPISPEHLTQSG
jgi:hydrogenase nickel incorporation protein HypB